MKVPTTEKQPATVEWAGKTPAFPKQAGEAQAPWVWVERSVWTERRLNRLGQSQEQTVWFSLWDKVWNSDNLSQAMLEVIVKAGSAGGDGQSPKQTSENWTREQERLQAELRHGRYRPQPARRVWMPKPGSNEPRPLGVPAVRDRVVQTALRHVLEPLFEREFAAPSCGFRPGRSALAALRRVEDLLQEGHPGIVDLNFKSYFDALPHQRLMEIIRRRVVDGKVLELLEAYLRAGVLETGKQWQATERGTPQGSVISPLLSNIHLNPLDQQMAPQGYEMVRYADDLVVCGRTEAQAQKAWADITVWTQAAGLTLHPTKTRIVDAAQKGGIDFLGCHFERYRESGGLKWPRSKSRNKLRDSLRGKLRHGRSGSIQDIAVEINPVLKGWFGHFKYSAASALLDADKWVRTRIRHILRRRQKRRGMAKGRERSEYPNHWFEAQGLFSLRTAQAQWIQSPTGNH